jgi:hypothetical protein
MDRLSKFLLIPAGIATAAGIGLDMMTNMLSLYWPDAPRSLIVALFYSGAALTFVPLPVWLIWLGWNNRRILTVCLVVGALVFIGGMGFQNWLSVPISVNDTKVELGPRKRSAIPATSVPTSVRILFGPSSVKPKEMQSQNIEWQAIEGKATGSRARYSISAPYIGGPPDPQAAMCSSPIIGYDERCYTTYEYKYLDLVLSFEKPITSKKIKVTAVQGAKPEWTQVIMTETDAVLRFDRYPADVLLDIEAVQPDQQ